MGSRVRRSIFGPLADHPDAGVPEMPRSVSGSRSSRRTSQAAEDLLRESSNLTVSLRTAMERAVQLNAEMQKWQQANLSEEFARRIEQDPLRKFNGQQAQANLQQYRASILGLERVEQLYRQFRLGCLSNFDDVDTVVVSDYTCQQSLERLEQQLGQLDRLRGDLLQNLHEYRLEIEPSSLVERVHSIEADQAQLKGYMERSITDVNLLMVNVLKHLKSTQQCFAQEVEKNRSLYGRLAAVLDSMEAMSKQTTHMKEQHRTTLSHFANLAAGSYASAMKATTSYRNTLAERLSIYESNYATLKQLAVETSIEEYHQRLEAYRAACIEFRNSLQQFDASVVGFERLLCQRQQAQALGRVVVTHSRQEDVSALRKLYDEIGAQELPLELLPLREKLLEESERDLKLVGGVLPERDRHASSVQLIRSRLKAYTQFFARLEISPVSYLLESKEEARAYHHQLSCLKDLQHEHRKTVEDYTRYFGLVLILAEFVESVSADSFALVSRALREEEPSELTRSIGRNTKLLDDGYRQGLPLGLEVSLFSIVNDFILLDQVCFSMKGIQAGQLRNEFTFEAFEEQLVDSLLLLKLENMVRIMMISDGNSRLRELMQDRQLGLYKDHLLETMGRIALNSIESQFRLRYPSQFFSLGSLCYVVERQRADKNFFLRDLYTGRLIPAALDSVFAHWKEYSQPDKIRTLIKLSLLQDVVRAHTNELSQQRFYSYTLQYLVRLLHNDLCLQMTVRYIINCRTPAHELDYHYLLLQLLSQRASIDYSPVYSKDWLQVEGNVKEFARSLREEGWVQLELPNYLNRQLRVVAALSHEKHLRVILTMSSLLRIQRLAMLYLDIQTIKQVTDHKVLPEPSDRIRIFTGKQYKWISLYELYKGQALILPDRYGHWFAHILAFFRLPTYDVKKSEPADGNMRDVFYWAVR